MVESLLVQFAPMLLGAQLILTLILVKGNICPGQRGRIHKMLPAIGVLWLAVASLRIEAFLIVFAIFYFYSQVQNLIMNLDGFHLIVQASFHSTCTNTLVMFHRRKRIIKMM